MSAVTCTIVGTGDEDLNKRTENEETSKTIARDIVFQMLDNVMNTIDDNMDKILTGRTKRDPVDDKPLPPLRGTGDQRSNEILEPQGPIFNNSRVEKKNRLTDLVKNSKQVLAKIISSESKSDADQKQEEKLVEVIDMDCADNEASRCTCKWSAEDVEQDTDEIMNHLSEEYMVEVNLDPTVEYSVANNKAITLKRKRRDVGGRFMDFCGKIRKNNHDEIRLKCQQSPEQSELEKKYRKVDGRKNQICSVL